MDLLHDKIEHLPQGTPAMAEREWEIHLKEVNEWERVTNDVPFGVTSLLRKEFRFNDYPATMEFTNQVADIAEKIGHHPDMLVQWCLITVSIHTHSMGGISHNDFVLAAHIDTI